MTRARNQLYVTGVFSKPDKINSEILNWCLHEAYDASEERDFTVDYEQAKAEVAAEKAAKAKAGAEARKAKATAKRKTTKAPSKKKSVSPVSGQMSLF